MNLKSPEDIIKAFTEKYLIINDNLIDVRRLFIAASVVRWIFNSTSRTEEILQYLGQVEKYLNGQIELYWQGDIIKVGRPKRGKK